MKIVALIGSFRKGSYNRMVFNHYRELAQGRCEFMEGAQSGIPIYNDDERERGLPPAVKQLAEQI